MNENTNVINLFKPRQSETTSSDLPELTINREPEQDATNNHQNRLNSLFATVQRKNEQMKDKLAESRKLVNKNVLKNYRIK